MILVLAKRGGSVGAADWDTGNELWGKEYVLGMSASVR